ncbi:MAG: hypothetical protein ACAI44_39355 [Candidatus Sericytochromatia bacterium]
MTSIRQRLQQDLQAPGNNLLKQVVGDHQLDSIEYQKLRTQYAGNDPRQLAEFDAQFSDFMHVNFHVAKSTIFGAKILTFPDVEHAGMLKLSEAKACLDAGKFWDFEKICKASTPHVQAEMRLLLNRTITSLPVNTEKQYQFAKEVLSSVASRLTPATLKTLHHRIHAFEAFTGRGASSVLNQGQIARCADIIRQHRKVPGTRLLNTETITQVVGHTPAHQSVTRFKPDEERELIAFLMNSSDPRMGDAQNRFEKLVGTGRPGGKPSYVDVLTEKIRTFPGKNLDPATVMKLALEATQGDYGLAVLAAHNLFKYIAYNARQTSAHPDGAPFKLSGDQITVMEKLGNLRPDASQNRDKMGPWYHFFGIQVLAAAYHSGDSAQTAVHAEHFIRGGLIKDFRGGVGNWVAGLFGGSVQPSPEDKEKAAVDRASVALAKELFP